MKLPTHKPVQAWQPPPRDRLHPCPSVWSWWSLTPLLLSCVACSGTEAEDSPTPSPTPWPATPTATSAPMPSDYIYEPEAPGAPALSLNALGSALVSAVQEAAQLDPAPIIAAYNTLDATGDQEGCPLRFYESYGPGYNADYWAGECNASSGTRYDGFGYRLLYDDWNDGSGVLYDGWTLYMSGRMTDMAGRYFQGAGAAADVKGQVQGGNIVYKVLDGSFVAGGSEVETAWLDGGLFPSLVVYAAYYPSLNGHYISLSGGLGGLSGEINTVAMTGVAIYDARMGSTCDQEPSGMISVRDAQGEWYDVLFDGPTEENPDVPRVLCDGCGQVWYRGQSLGQTCGNFGPLLDWKEKPW